MVGNLGETASPNEKTRLAVTLSCRSKKARLLWERRDDLAVTPPASHCEGRRPEAIRYFRSAFETASQTKLRARSDKAGVIARAFPLSLRGFLYLSLRAKRSSPAGAFPAVASEAKQSGVFLRRCEQSEAISRDCFAKRKNEARNDR